MALIAIVAGVIAFNIQKAVAEQRFKSDVAVVASRLNIAQNLMLFFNSDVTIHLVAAAEGGYELFLTLEKPPKQGWENEVLRKQKLISFKEIEFDGKEGAQHPPLKLEFFSKGSLMSRGQLFLSSKSGQKALFYLPGHPRYLRAQFVKDKTKGTFGQLNEEKTDQAITEYTVTELKEVLRKYEQGQKADAQT